MGWAKTRASPKGLQPESALAALLVLAIERLLPSPGALPSPILAATHTCFMVLVTLSAGLFFDQQQVQPAAVGAQHLESQVVHRQLVAALGHAAKLFQDESADRIVVLVVEL